MSLGLSIVVGAVGVCLVLAVAIALIRSRRPVRGLIGSGAQGLCALAAVNVVGAFTGGIARPQSTLRIVLSGAGYSGGGGPPGAQADICHLIPASPSGMAGRGFCWLDKSGAVGHSPPRRFLRRNAQSK